MKKKIVFLIIAFLVLVFGAFTYFYIDFSSGKQKADKYYMDMDGKVKRILNMGSTKTLEILPLVD